MSRAEKLTRAYTLILRASARARLAASMIAVAQFASATPLVAQISSEEYAERRVAIAKLVGNGPILALGATLPQEDYFHFWQIPDFRYLTGITEPDAALVLIVRDGAIASATLFVNPRDPTEEKWTGARMGTEGARIRTGINARPAQELHAYLDSLLSMRRDSTLRVIADYQGQTGANGILSRDHQIINRLLATRRGIAVQRLALDKLRSVKSPAEEALIRKAAVITDRAQREAMRALRPGLNEFEIQALVEYTFRRNGADRPSFTTVIGSGLNSTILHYSDNDRFMRDGDMVVMDIGAFYRGYAADITRTVPVNGKFTREQRDIYQVVLDTQKAWERRNTPGADRVDPRNAPMLAQRLADLGLIEGPRATYDCDSIGTEQCLQISLYTGGFGHPVGLEVHDVGNLNSSPVTNEPGVYVRANALDELADTPRNRVIKVNLAPAVRRYANIGVRIEDMYVRTERTLERLSQAPREIEEIEALMQSRSAALAPREPTIIEWYRRTAPTGKQ